jgi:hypothetical protein
VAQTLGIVDIVWRGQKLAAERGASLRLGGVKNNPVITGRQVHRAGEMEPSEITATIPLMRGQRLLDIVGDGREGELQCICDTGQTYVFADAFLSNRPTVTGGEGGKVELIWMAGEAEELLNG